MRNPPTKLTKAQEAHARRLMQIVGPKRPGELKSEYVRRIFMAQEKLVKSKTA